MLLWFYTQKYYSIYSSFYIFKLRVILTVFLPRHIYIYLIFKNCYIEVLQFI